MAITLVTAPTIEPVELADAKIHLAVASDDTDTYIVSLLKAAREWCEVYTRQTIMTTTWRQTFPCWPSSGVIELYRPPLQSVTSVQYVDGDGATQTLDTDQYVVDTDSDPGRILSGYGVTLPTLRTTGVASPVTVVFIAGYASASDVPESYRHAIKLIIGHWFENRNEVVVGKTATNVPLSARALLKSVSHGSYP